MRIAYVAQSIPVTADVEPNPLAAEDLVELAERDDLVVFVDENTRGSEILTRSGVDVSISPKRPLDIDGEMKESDALVAAELATRHAERAFDEIWYSSEYLSDLSWYNTSLSSIRQMIVLDSGAIRLTRLIWSHPDSIRSYGVQSWAMVGRLVRADGLISDVSPLEYGLRADLLPDVRATGISIPSPAQLPEEPGLAVVVVGWADERDMSRSILEATRVVGVSERTTFVILHDDFEAGGTSAGRMIWQCVPDEIRRSTILVPFRSDGTAASFLDRAEVIVCATPAEAVISAVRTRMYSTPFVILDDRPGTVGSVDRDGRPCSDRVFVVEVGQSQTITEALSKAPEGSAVVIHTAGHADNAGRIAAHGSLEAADISLVCEPDGIYGSLSTRLCGDVIGIASQLRSGFEQVHGDQSLGEAIRSLMNPANAGRVSLQLLPISGVDVFDAEWRMDEDRVLPVSRGLIDVGPIVVGVRPSESVPPPTYPAPREWVETLAWKDRLRLLLPWKWGLLGRAMRGRW